MKRYIVLIALLSVSILFSVRTDSQTPFKQLDFGHAKTDYPPTEIQWDKAPAPVNLNRPRVNYAGKELDAVALNRAMGVPVVLSRDKNGRPVAIEYQPQEKMAISSRADIATAAHTFLSNLSSTLGLHRAEEHFEMTDEQWDEQGMVHVRMQQELHGIPVYGGEVLLHGDSDGLNYFNGHYYSIERADAPTPSISQEEAMEEISRVEGHSITNDMQGQKRFHGLNAYLSQLVDPTRIDLTYWWNGEKLDLVWYCDYYTSAIDHWRTFVDAQTGEVLKRTYLTCSLLGPVHNHSTGSEAPAPNSKSKIFSPPVGDRTATGRDLNGVNQTIHVWNQNGQNYLIDASRPMFKSASSNMPDEPIGAMITLDAENTHPQNQDFHVGIPFNANNQWSPLQISAHHNAIVAYEYFRQVHQRNSINGVGGNIISIYNVSETDGGGMDNAFWSGKAMFYGNGRDAFDQLAGGLDVAGHEMTHGVIDATANLNYEGESGAINESMADVFGAMIDRDDWQLGEDVVIRRFFPSGFLRDMSNPHNGGNRLGDPGWQPAHVNEQYHGSEDNGGVHINSGIPNQAFYLFVQNMAKRIGEANAKEQGERIYYRALSRYLTRSSQFVDLRAAIIKAAQDLYGSQEVTDVQNAFAAVGIGSGGSTGGQDKVDDLPINPGNWFFVVNDRDYRQTNLYDLQTQSGPIELFNMGVRSKVSMTDNGVFGVFVGQDRKLYGMTRQANGSYNVFIVEDSQPWRNAAISKDGTSLALLRDQAEPVIFVWNFPKKEGQDIQLYNPTTAQGVEAGDVQYAEAIEFDPSGEYILYDALSRLRSNSGTDYEYWDIGFLHVWDNNANNWGTGRVSKLISDLPEDVSIGNPTFSKNSPYIIAFDILDQRSGRDQYIVLGANIETGNIGVFINNNELGFPNYSIDDKNIVFNATDQSGNPLVALIEVAADKINSTGDASILLSGGRWGVFFADGERNLQIKTKDVIGVEAANFQLMGSSEDGVLNIRNIGDDRRDIQLRLRNIQGRLIDAQSIGFWPKGSIVPISVGHLPDGVFIIQVENKKVHEQFKWIK